MQGKNFILDSAKKDENNHKESIEQAIDLFKKGLNFHEIAEKLNLSKTHLVRSFPKQILIVYIEELLNQGLSYEKMGEQIGIDPVTVIKYAKEGGIHEKYSTHVINLFKDRIPISEIAHRLKTQPQQIINIIPHEQKCDLLREYYIDQKLLFKDITKLLGISKTSLKNWLSRYKLKRRHVKAGEETKDYPKSEIILDYLRLNSITNISTRRGFPDTTIRRILQQAGVTRSRSLTNIRKHVNGTFDVPLNKFLMEVISGELLGDLGIENRGSRSMSISHSQYSKAINNIQSFKKKTPEDLYQAVELFNQSLPQITKFSMARFRLNMAIYAIPWGKHIMSLFETNGISLFSHFDNANSLASNYHNFSIWSGFNASIKDLYDLWYPKNIKIIPKNISLSPTTLLHWFIGDGSATREIIFSTHNFNVDDVISLVDRLNKTLDIESHWRYQNKKKNQPRKYYCQGPS